MAKQKKLVRVVCAVLALLMAATLVLPALSRAFADDETPAEKLERLRKEIAALHDQIEASEENEQNAQQTKLYYQQLSNTLSAQLEALQEDIDVRKSDLEKKNLAIAQAAEELQAAKEAFEQRLRGMYEMRSSSNLSILLGIDDISDAMRFAENLQQIAVSDNQLITEMHDKQVKLENQREEINAALDELNAQQEELENTKTSYQQAIQKADETVTAEQAQQQVYEESEAELQEQFKQAQQEWAAWAGSNTGNSYVLGDGLGQFQWPIPGYTTLSSDFGTVRYIYGVRDVHRGMDVPAPAGTRIYAAADGVVSTTAHWSYGTCVKISHSPSLVTIYGHMSARAAGITDGVFVTQRQLIGYVGSTGNSTGNHLHFEVNVNGTPVSAWPYLNGG